MKSLITEEILRERLLPCDATIEQCRVRGGNGWKVKFPCGVVATFSPEQITSCDRNKASHEDYEQAVYECCDLVNEVRGGIGIYGGASKKDTKAFIEWCEAYGFKVNDNPRRGFSTRQVPEYFGEGATVEKKSGGWQVSLPNGSGVLFKQRRIWNVWGDPQVYEAALRMMSDNYGVVLVAGTKENVLGGIAHGKALSIEVIPELYVGEAAYKRVGGVAGALSIIPAIIIGINYENIAYGVVGALMLAWVGSAVYGALFIKDGTKIARERGQALKSSFPAVHGASASRKASMDEVRERGMII